MTRILALGDIVGHPARDLIRRRLPGYIEERGIDFVMANGENAASGSGIVPEQVKELIGCGIDVLTTGDHIWKRAKIAEYIAGDVPLLRPANYPSQAAGRGCGLFPLRNGGELAVINLIGRVYMMGPADCPFRAADALLDELAGKTNLILVDMHAEATSEKVAMGWYLDGRVTAVLGTHTHIPTADERVLPEGTAYLTDLGMCGPYQSVLGRRIDRVLSRFVTGMYAHFDVAGEDVRLSGALIEADPATGTAASIERITIRDE